MIDYLLIVVILVIAVCASLCRFNESWKSIEDFTHLREDWLRQFLKLSHGIPSHDTIRRFFLLLDAIEFQKYFQNWASSFKRKILGETVAIDGKALKGSRDNALEKKAIYILGLKRNQGNLHDDVTTYIKDQLDHKITDSSHQTKETVDADHGRIEEIKFHLFSKIDWLEQRPDWAGLKAIGVIESKREIKGKTSFERRFYITSLESIDKFSKGVREHWGVENSLHWTLDVAFDEDRSTRKKGNSPANSSVLKHITLNLLKKEKTLKRSINTKRSHACMNLNYLEKVVFG